MTGLDKFEVPDSGIALEKRTQLEQRLLRSVASKAATLITAPPGSGKSMLLARIAIVAREGDMIPVWYSCDASDREVSHFLKQLGLALRRALTKSGLAGGEEASFLSPNDLGQVVAARGCKVVLLLDNFHLCDGPETAGLINAIVNGANGCLHPIVSARARTLVGTASLQVSGQIAEFTAADLAFSAEEAGRFINLRPGRLNDARIQHLIKRTEGWAAALQFIRLLVQDGGDIDQIARDFSGADENVRLFLYEEVFNSLPENLRRFLLDISCLDRISATLAEAVTQLPNAMACFNELIERNLFVIPLDRRRQWIRLHSVFRGFLEAQAKREGAHPTKALTARAADWHWRHGNELEAVNYAIDTQDYDKAVAWLKECGNEVVTRRGELIAFLSCCDRLPTEALQDSDLILWVVWSAAFSLSWVDASALLNRHVAALEAMPDESHRIMLVRTLLTFFSHDFRTTINLAQDWLRGAEGASVFDRATIAAALALSLRAQLRKQEALQWLERSRRDVLQTSSAYGQAWVATISAFFAISDGRVYEAREELEASLSSEAPIALVRSTAEPALALAYYELNQLDEARAVVKRALPMLMQHGAVDIAQAGWRTAAMIELHDHGPEPALQMLINAEGLALRRYGARGPLLLRMLKSELLLRLSDEQRRLMEARGLGVRYLSNEASDWCPDLSERRQMLDAREHLMEGQPRAALSALGPVLVATRSDGRITRWAEASCIKAAAELMEGDDTRAERTLLDCIARAAPMGIHRTIVDESTILRGFGAYLSGYLSHARGDIPSEVRAVIGNLLESMQMAWSGEAQLTEIHAPIETFSPQELKIISLLSQGLANKEIAQHMTLALPTIKWYVYRIYQKLGVRARTAAVRKARSLGILS